MNATATTVTFALDPNLTYQSAAFASGATGTVSQSGGTVTATDGGGSQAYILAVGKANTATGVTALPNSAVFGQGVTLMATVTSGAGPPTGTVTFTSGSFSATAPLNGMGVATTSTAALPVGANQTITATYNGDGNFTGSSGTTTATVNRVTITLTAPITAGSGNSGSATMPVLRAGGTLTLVAQSNGPVTGMTYTSSDPTTVSVNATTGAVTANRAGTATITASGSNGASGTITVTVLGAAGTGLMPMPQPMTHADAPQATGAATPNAQPAQHP